VLEGEKAEKGHACRLFVAVYRKDAALLARFVFLFDVIHHHFLALSRVARGNLTLALSENWT
jgi:hypothetical protein